MALKIYNTMTRKKEPFIPLEDGKVGIYACGVTVYDYSHIGHARAMVVFDVIQRYFKAGGYEVNFVRNYTDIDDKIINRANEEGVTYDVISERYIQEFDDDMRSLGVEPPTHTPRATGHIQEMISMVTLLIEKGKAYEVDGDVYFSVGAFPGYGKLSGKNLDDLLSGARVEVDNRKRSPLDFALWKKSKEGEPSWDCPWGKGRPGWHIECSAMSQKYLGETFDMHGGGMDLVFPHHENEIAQAECTTGKTFARYWVHNGFVNINHEKMSKSLKNFLTIRDVLKSYHAEVVRLFLLSNHYRSPIDFSDQNLAEAKTGLERFYRLLFDMENAQKAKKAEPQLNEAERAAVSDIRAFTQKFQDAMDDDFNTAAALGHLYSLTRTLNSLVDRCKKEAGFMLAEEIAVEARKVFAHAGGVFGLLQEKPAGYFEKQREAGSASRGITPEEIQALIDERLQAKKEKNWARADAIRNNLADKGVLLKDSPQGTQWSFRED